MHKEIKDEYREFLKNLKVPNRDIHAEYKLCHTLLAGTEQQILTVISQLDGNELYDQAARNIFLTVKEDFEKGNTHEGQAQYSHIVTTYSDRFATGNLHFNLENKEYSSLDNFFWGKAPSDDEINGYIEVVKRKHDMRTFITQVYNSLELCQHTDDGTAKARSYLQGVFEEAGDASSAAIIPQMEFASSMVDIVNVYNDPVSRKGKTINLPWPKYQKEVGGFHEGDLVIVSAKSGHGKSAFSMNIAIEVGVKQKIPTLYINSEMSKELLNARYLSYMAYIDSRKIFEGGYYDDSTVDKLNPMIADKVIDAGNKYAQGKLLFATIPDLQIANIEKIIRQDCAERGTRMVIVDYIGRMDVTQSGIRDLKEYQIMRIAANKLKTMAQKYNITVIMVAQLTDEGTLQGSRSMKNEADLFLSIKRFHKDDSEDKAKLDAIFPYNTVLKIEKARGISDDGTVSMRYEGAMMRFCDTKEAIKEMVDRNAAYGKYANELLEKDEYQKLKNKIEFGIE